MKFRQNNRTFNMKIVSAKLDVGRPFPSTWGNYLKISHTIGKVFTKFVPFMSDKDKREKSLKTEFSIVKWKINKKNVFCPKKVEFKKII